MFAGFVEAHEEAGICRTDSDVNIVHHIPDGLPGYDCRLTVAGIY